MNREITPRSLRSGNLRRQHIAACIAAGLLFSANAAFSAGQDASATQQDSAQPPAVKSVEVPESKPGDADFDKAIEMRLNVSSVEQLNEIISLSESAIEKGLTPASEEGAKSFLSSLYKQRVEINMRQMMQARRSRSAMSKMLGELLDDLTKSIDLDPGMIDSYVIKVAILRDRQEFSEAIDVINKGIEHFEGVFKKNQKSGDTREKLAKLYVNRATLQDDMDLQVADIEKAAEVNPSDPNIIKQLLAMLESQNKTDKVLKALDDALEYNPDNLEFQLAKVSFLLRDDQDDAAIEFCTKCIEQSTDDENKAALLRQRSLLHQVAGKNDLAKADLDASIALAKDSVPSILLRARLSASMDALDAAKEDIQKILELDEQNPDAILLRADIATADKEYEAAISDYRNLIARVQNGSPQKEELLMKLGLALWQNDSHKQALRVLDQVLQVNDGNWQAHRLQGEIMLSLGDHADAVTAYEKALNLMPDTVNDEIRSSLLNNLSWLLATSTEDEIRDANRALELGTKACELTNFEAAHIVSTLAAAYAEKGDFDKAVEFAQKAVDLGKKEESEQQGHLEEELKSYQDKKPWREKQSGPEQATKPNLPAPTGPGT